MVRFARPHSWAFPNFLHRLPSHYYRHRQDLLKTSTRVHDIPVDGEYFDLNYNKEKEKLVRVADTPIPVMYPKEADEGLWGGEGIIKGYVKPRKFFQAGIPRAKMWFPNLKKAVFYSEILDKHLQIICTQRTLSLVDQHCGFDNYIMRTPVQDFKSQLALNLKRLMLLKLIRKEFNDHKLGEELVEKYKDCLIPEEEAEWYGLSEGQAVVKQKLIDARQNKPVPLKVTLAKELIEELQKMKDSGELDVIIKKEDSKLQWLGTITSKIPFLKSKD